MGLEHAVLSRGANARISSPLRAVPLRPQGTMPPLLEVPAWPTRTTGFKPYVPDEAQLRELTPRALVVGSLLGLVFGASSVYLALRVGLTVSASVPIAVVSITLFRAFSRVLGGRASILENTVVQTTGSAGESIAAGVAFTLPALVLLGFEMGFLRTMVIALCGGLLGVLMMVPLRRYLIVKEHGRLTYPEGTACAEVLIAGEERGPLARRVFQGLFAGLLFKLVTSVHELWRAVPAFGIPGYKAAKVACDISPELLGVGYIIGYRSSAIMVGGGLLSWLVLIPAIALFGERECRPRSIPRPLPSPTMSPDEIWGRYIRYIGAGAVAAGGIINLLKALPTIVDSFRASFRDLRLVHAGRSRRRGPAPSATSRSRSCSGGCVALVLFMSFLPQIRIVPGAGHRPSSRPSPSCCSGSSSASSPRASRASWAARRTPSAAWPSPPSWGCAPVFVVLGWTGHAYTAAALSIGAIVCIASSNAGTTSQDLKTSFLVGGTPGSSRSRSWWG